MWDELDVNKNKALVDAKNKDLIKPTLGQRLSNFFTSQAKRRENAKIEAKQREKKQLKTLKKVGGIVGTGIVKGVTLKLGKSIKDWYEKIKQKEEKESIRYLKINSKVSKQKKRK